MSKVVVYVLDKIVWMLLITAVTTQALQIVGVVDTPKGLGDIAYKQDNEYNFQVQVGGSDVRGKRQTDQRSRFIDNLFNVSKTVHVVTVKENKKDRIPISTLNAVNNLVQSSRPAFQSLRDFAARKLERANQAAQSNNQLLRQQKVQAVEVLNKEETVTKQ
ncbi:hypothetical protein Zmor_006802 [Zophobas morio]|uniref:Uncharacterized protein n=1 Tax=Zophobas morio TaxID=2755281 RepID=A0AA38MNM0_9CUCU|nr:hypothetical protein Zmor_006802 [Zophobas morio]